jgi:predicted AlkP superfamily pyrophosphatase or phosphodiesterase
MKFFSSRIHTAFIGIFFLFTFFIYAERPNLVIIFVVDQLSHDNLIKLKPYFTGGLKTLLEKGTIYTQAYWPHSMPGTGPGHASLSTGALPSTHGIIDNSWMSVEGKKVYCDDDSAESAAVFSPDGLYDFGKSAKNIMADTLADQLILQSTANSINKSFSLSLKSRSGIAMEGHAGIALWFDDKTSFFTSSKAYMQELPAWVKHFNAGIDTTQTYTWKLTYPEDHPAYQWATKNTYAYTKYNSLIGSSIAYDNPEKILLTPYAHELLLSFAKHCLDNNLKSTTTFMLWLGLSSTDKIGHQYGANSVEYIDMLYKLDRQLGHFMHYIFSLNSPERTLFVLTADHGSMPIPEIAAQKGLTLAHRVDTKALKTTLNSLLEYTYGLSDFIVHIDTPDIYFDRTLAARMPEAQKEKIIKLLKETLMQQSGIRNVWAADELMHGSFTESDIRWLYQNQLYPGRSGDLIFQVLPYTYPDRFTTGTGHRTPYNYDRHVPLIIYQPQTITGKQIVGSVYGQQVAPTLAYILGIPRPSAATFPLLPGIDYTQFEESTANTQNHNVR